MTLKAGIWIKPSGNWCGWWGLAGFKDEDSGVHEWDSVSSNKQLNNCSSVQVVKEAAPEKKDLKDQAVTAVE